MNIITYSLVNQTNFSDLHMPVQKGGGGKEGKKNGNINQLFS